MVRGHFQHRNISCMLYLNDCMNPVEHLFDIAVDTWSSLPGTADAPAHHSYLVPFRGGEVHKRTPTVPLGLKTMQKQLFYHQNILKINK